ncbi:MAG: DUF434 domain-containing protein [Planctomycetes bacterium]|jgi:hypothetical protein|nr:DUF434 domain-containing protein [Planctomycetota bacterium]
MPDTREHRGPHPEDAKLFAPEMLPRLGAAAADFSLLLTKGYAEKSALKLVGDHFSLTQRQRVAVMRSSCSDQQLQSRRARCVPVEDLAGRPLAIDGYNLLITIEAALSGGLIFRGRDGCCRDLASIHGTYRKVEETIPALQLIGDFLASIGNREGTRPGGRGAGEERGLEPEARGSREFFPRPASPGLRPSPGVLWLLDSPVSNSGRLKTLIGALARDHGWPWEVRLTLSPDAELSRQLTVPGSQLPDNGQPPTDNCPLPAVVVSTDSVVLDACPHWTNLAAAIITQRVPRTPVIALGPDV